jgi:hypothetical protein
MVIVPVIVDVDSSKFWFGVSIEFPFSGRVASESNSHRFIRLTLLLLVTNARRQLEIVFFAFESSFMSTTSPIQPRTSTAAQQLLIVAFSHIATNLKLYDCLSLLNAISTPKRDQDTLLNRFRHTSHQ